MCGGKVEETGTGKAVAGAVSGKTLALVTVLRARTVGKLWRARTLVKLRWTRAEKLRMWNKRVSADVGAKTVVAGRHWQLFCGRGQW